MKLFLFERIDKVTSNWHCEGGLAVVADSRAQVEALLAEHETSTWDHFRPTITDEEWATVHAFDLQGKQEPRVFVFPDAGCC